jgi:hypothetical protein
VAEELALEQVGGDGAAVDDHERLIAPGAGLVHGLGGGALAGAGLALEQHGRVGGRGALEQGEGATHGRRPSDQAAELLAR